MPPRKRQDDQAPLRLSGLQIAPDGVIYCALGQTAEPPTIIAYGPRQYGTNSSGCVVVNESEDDVLLAFLDHGPALDLPNLRKHSGHHDANQILRRLAYRYGGIFASAIALPGARARGGYRVKIKTC